MGKFDEGKLPTDPHLMLRLAIETVAHDYDVIVIDSAPNPGIGTINVVCAADVLIVPTPAELFDYTSALQFSICFVICSRTLILKGSSLMYVFCLPNTAIVMALSPRGWRSKFGMPGKHGSKNVVRETDEVGKGQIRMRTVLNRPLINALQLVPGEMLFLFGNLSAMKFSIV